MTPTLRQIEYAVALADKQNFRRAAESCHVSQPALSAQIRQLETRLGVALFERGRKVMMTPAGQVFVERGRAILRGVEDLVTSTVSSRTPLAGRLAVGMIPTVAPYLLPPVLEPLQTAFPDLSLILHEGPTDELVREIEAGKLDVGLVALEADLHDLETLPLFKDPFLLAAPPGDAAIALDQLTESDFHGLEEQLLLLEDAH